MPTADRPGMATTWDPDGLHHPTRIAQHLPDTPRRRRTVGLEPIHHAPGAVPMHLTLTEAAAAAGALVPFAAAVLTQAHFSRAANSVIALTVSLVAAVGSAYTTGRLDGASGVTAAVVVVTLAQATYRSVYEPIGVTPWLQELTSFRLPQRGRHRRQVADLTAQVEALSKALAETGAPRTVGDTAAAGASETERLPAAAV